MGAPNLIPIPQDGDWPAVRKALQVLAARLGPGGAPHFAGLDVDVLTADALTIPGLSGVLQATAGVVSGSALHAALGSIGANDHHNQAHVLNGADHTVSGLTPGHILTALTATTFGFAAPVDLGLSSLTDPGADRILFWDETDNALKWLGMGNSVAITGTTLDAIQDIRTTAAPQFAGLTLTGAATGILPTTGPELATKEYVDLATTHLNRSYFLLNAAGATGGYKALSDTQSVLSKATLSVAGATDAQVLGGWIFPTVSIAGEEYHLGRYGLHIHARKTNVTNQTIALKWTLVERKADTSEVTVGTSETSGNLTASATSYDLHLNIAADYAITTGSYLVLEVIAVVAGTGVAPDVDLYYQGTEASEMDAPATSSFFNDVYVRLDGRGNLTEATSSVLTITGGTNGVLGGVSLQVKQAATGQSGYLSNTDWNTFNGKAAKTDREIINTLLGVHITLDHSVGAYKLLCDAVVDAMETNGGVDGTVNLSADYDTTNDWHNPTVEAVSQSQTTATSNGNMGDVGGVETRYAQTFTFSTAYQCPRVDVYLNAANGSPTGNITCRIETTSGGVPTGTLISVGASITRAAATGWVSFDFNSVLQFGVAIPASTVYALVLVVDNQATDNYFKWGRIATGGYANGQACVSVDGGANWAADGSADMAFKIYRGGNMRLQSITFTANTQPATAKIVILESDDTIVLNSDITAQVSRDGGTTWATVTLASKGLLDASNSILYGSADVSGQPAGTSMKWRIETADEHVIRIRGVALVWE